MRRLIVLSGFLLTLAMASSLFAQRADRGIITGVVTDPSGAAVPGASVTIINSDTGASTPVSTSQAGNYGSPPLTLGTYTVRIEKEGFKTFLRSGILLEGGITYRQDAALELGATATTIEVKAASEMINVSSAEVGHSLGARYYEDLPVVMGADIRLAEALLAAQPGYVPMQPNGDAMFRGSQFNSRINGGQTMATENWMDGAAFGYARGHQQTQESSPPFEAVREVKVINSSFSAQYGHTSGAFVEYVSKSGSNDWHGSVFEYLGNSALNARRTFEKDIPDPNGVVQPGTAVRPSKNNEYGFTLGGPIRKDKTHFFTNLEFLNLRQIVSSGYLWTMPTAQFKSGDLSPLLYVKNPAALSQIGTDVLGRPIYDGQIFDPTTTRLVGSVPVRDAFGFDPVTGAPIAGQANIIPSCTPGAVGCNRSLVASRYLPLVPLPDRAGLSLNTFGGAGDPHHILDAKTWLLRIDHAFSPSLKTTSTFWTNSRPAIRKCGSPGACDVPSDPFTAPEKNDTYVSDGFYQRISNRYLHQQFDWVIKPTLFNHTTIAYDRWYMGGYSISDGVGWLDKLGISGYPGAFSTDGGPPHIDWQGGVYGYTDIGTNWGRGFEAVNRWQFADDLTWISGKHTIKAGFEWRWHEFNQAGWARGVAGNFGFSAAGTGVWDSGGSLLTRTGDPVASMIMGQVNYANYFIGMDNTFSERYWSPWINDEIKVNDKLTINFGLRFDYQQARTERHNRQATFDPTVMNPVGVAGGLLYATPDHRSFEDSPRDAWGPRFGFAYRATNKDVVRGGYGIYYAGIQWDMWMGSPTRGYEASPNAANLTNGLWPAGCSTDAVSSGNCYGNWDDPFPQNRVIWPSAASRTAAFDNGGGPIAVSPTGLTLPRYQNWSLTWERQISSNLLVDISYVGNHGTRLITNMQAAGLGQNMSDPKYLAIDNCQTVGANGECSVPVPGVLGSSITLAENQALAVVQAMPVDPADGLHKPYAGYAGSLAQALRPYPQYQGIGWRNLNSGMSTFHSLQAKMEKRFSNGLQFRLAWVWSKLMVKGPADSGNSTAWAAGVQDPLFTMYRAISEDDIPHTIIAAYTYQFPFGPGKKYGANMNPVLGKFVSGWGVSGMQRYDSGRPLAITMNNNMGGLISNGAKFPNNTCNGSWTGGKFDPSTDRYWNSSCWSNPDVLSPTGAVLQYKFGNAPVNDSHARTFPLFNEDISLIKDTYFRGERFKVRFEAQFGNIFNRTFLCNPNTNWSSGDFGKVGAQCNIPRRIQFGLRVDF